LLRTTIKRLEVKAGISIKYIISSFVIVLLLGIYIANIFFGTNSIYTLVELREKKFVLQTKVHQLKQTNKRLQKNYFELKQLDAKDNL
jgi:cell division protein FtsB